MTNQPFPLQTASIGFAILAFSMGVGRFAFTPILPIMQTEGLVSVSHGGLLASVHFVGYAMGAWLAGRLTSAPRKVLFASLTCIALATIAMGLVDFYVIWLVARWITGLCSALVLVVVSTYFVKQLTEIGRPDLQGSVFAGVGGGTALVGLATLGLISASSPSWLVWQVFGLATLAATAILFIATGRQSFIGASQSSRAGDQRSPLAWRLLLPYGAMGAGYIIPATYLPIMAQQAVSSPMVYGWAWPVFGLAAAISTLIAARLHARCSNSQIWICSQLVMAFGLLLPAFWPQIGFVVIGGLCVGGTFMVITMAGLKEAHRVAGSTNPQNHIAAMTMAFALGQIIGPVLAGWMYEMTESFAYPLFLGSAILVVTLVPISILPAVTAQSRRIVD